ncbi:MAG: prepilin-type N-terminal cleavage/methylation domain-containing protein [Armatimonadota bacterium]
MVNKRLHSPLRRRCGFSLIEVLFGIFLLAVAGIVFSALYPLGTKMTASARYRGQAIRIARGQMESLRRVALDSGKLDYIRNKDVASLKTKLDVNEAVVDSSATAASLTFTGVPLSAGETVNTILPGGVGTFTVTADSPATERTILKVTVSWKDSFGTRSVDLYGVVTKYMK